jgi:hypothetical protein
MLMALSAMTHVPNLIVPCHQLPPLRTDAHQGPPAPRPHIHAAAGFGFAPLVLPRLRGLRCWHQGTALR